MLEIIDINKSFGKNKVLDNINLKIESGVIYGLLGKNGVGKTTLINIMIDLMQSDSGQIIINNKLSTELDKHDKRNIGVVAEDLALIEELNGLEYLKFIGKIYQLPENAIETRIKDLYNYFFEGDGDLNKNISKYSTGMKKDSLFCAAVIHTPEILILDEPFSGLDPLVANQMINFLQAYKKETRTIFISSHDLSYIEKVASHIGVLNEKQLQFNSTLQDFTENGESTLDNALLKILKPYETELSKIDWL